MKTSNKKTAGKVTKTSVGSGGGGGSSGSWGGSSSSSTRYGGYNPANYTGYSAAKQQAYQPTNTRNLTIGGLPGTGGATSTKPLVIGGLPFKNTPSSGGGGSSSGGGGGSSSGGGGSSGGGSGWTNLGRNAPAYGRTASMESSVVADEPYRDVVEKAAPWVERSYAAPTTNKPLAAVKPGVSPTVAPPATGQLKPLTPAKAATASKLAATTKPAAKPSATRAPNNFDNNVKTKAVTNRVGDTLTTDSKGNKLTYQVGSSGAVWDYGTKKYIHPKGGAPPVKSGSGVAAPNQPGLIKPGQPGYVKPGTPVPGKGPQGQPGYKPPVKAPATPKPIPKSPAVTGAKPGYVSGGPGVSQPNGPLSSAKPLPVPKPKAPAPPKPSAPSPMPAGSRVVDQTTYRGGGSTISYDAPEPRAPRPAPGGGNWSGNLQQAGAWHPPMDSSREGVRATVGGQSRYASGRGFRR